MMGRKLAVVLAVALVAGGLTSCDWVKGVLGMGVTTDFRNAQIDVSDTACSDNAKFSTLVLRDGKYELGQYQFELFGETKRGDVSGRTAAGNNDDAVFVGDCAIDGQTSQILFVYGTRNGALKRLGTANLTDNGKGLVQSYDVKDSTILVEQNLGNPPTLSKTSYALLNGKVTDLSAPSNPVVAANGTGDIDVVNFESFRAKLQPYGKWIDHPRWGWAWHPLATDFRPYQNGHWEDSGEYGAVWVSSDAWGDLPYHYGRWGYDPGYGGWLWVPGYVWGPSWVAWRNGDDNLGWFPIPPGAWDGEGDYPDDWNGWYGYRDLYGAAFDAAAFYALWSFVPSTEIFAPSIRERIIDRRGYGRFIDHTRNFTHYGIVHGHVVSRAFEPRRFAAAFHHGLPPGMRHDFAPRHVASFAAGRRIAEHERLGVGVHGGMGVEHARIGIHEGGTGFHVGTRVGTYHREGVTASGFAHSAGAHGFSRTGTYHTSGYSRFGGGSSAGGFARSSRAPGAGGFSRSGGSSAGGYVRSGGGFTRQGFGGSSGNGFSRQGFGGSGVSGGNALGHPSSGGGNAFGHFGGTTAARSAPAPRQASGNQHHH